VQEDEHIAADAARVIVYMHFCAASEEFLGSIFFYSGKLNYQRVCYAVEKSVWLHN
jgi:hypothetical protein